MIADEQKLKTLDGMEWGITRSSGQSYDSDLQTYNSWSSSLSYTRQSMTDYLFANFSFDMFPSYMWSQSIAVQGFALDWDTAKLDYQYIPIDDGEEQWPVRGVYTRANDGPYDEVEFDYLTQDGLMGCAFTYYFDTPYADATGVYYHMEVEGSVSNVNLPVNGQPGGSFNIFGNLVFIAGYDIEFSFSLPWGISVAQGELVEWPCRTSLFATLYAD